jgi:hypothetical protein
VAGKWVIRWTDQSGVKFYIKRLKQKTSFRFKSRWLGVRTPVLAQRFFRQEQAERAAFTVTVERPDLLGKLVVIEWDGNTKAKP